MRPPIGLSDFIMAMTCLSAGNDLAREQMARVLGIELRSPERIISVEVKQELSIEDFIEEDKPTGDDQQSSEEKSKIDLRRGVTPVIPSQVQAFGPTLLKDPIIVAPIEVHSGIKEKRSFTKEELAIRSTPWEPLFEQASQSRIAGLLARSWLPSHGGLDLETLVDELAQLRLSSPLPMLHGFGLASKVQVLMDASYPMEPFFLEQKKLIEKIQGICGATVEILRFAGTPLFGVQTWGSGPDQDYVCPSAGTPIIILSHFQMGKSGNRVHIGHDASWLQFASMIRQGGCHPIGVIPLPLESVSHALLDAIPMVSWDFMTSLADVARTRKRGSIKISGQRKHWTEIKEPPVDDDLDILRQWRKDNPEVVHLARRASWASHVEPRVLRHLRTRITPRLNVQAEWDLLHSPLIRNVDFRGFTLKHEIRNRLLLELLSEGKWEQDLNLIQKMQKGEWRVNYTATLKLEEELLYHGLRPLNRGDSPEEEVDRTLNELFNRLPVGGAEVETVAYWIVNAFPGLPKRVNDNPLYWALLQAAALLFPYRRTEAKPPMKMRKDIQGIIPGIVTRFLENVKYTRGEMGIQRMENQEGILLSYPPAAGVEFLLKIPFSPPFPPFIPDPIPWPLEIQWIDADKRSRSQRIDLIPGQTIPLMSGSANLVFYTALGEESQLHWNGTEYRILILTCRATAVSSIPNQEDWRFLLSREIETAPGQRIHPRLNEVDVVNTSVAELQEMAMKYDHVIAHYSKPNAPIVYALAGLIELGQPFSLLTEQEENISIPDFLKNIPKITRNTLLAYYNGQLSEEEFKPTRDSLLGLDNRAGKWAGEPPARLLKDLDLSLQGWPSEWESKRPAYHLLANFGQDGNIMKLSRHQWLQQISWPAELETFLHNVGLSKESVSLIISEQKDKPIFDSLLDAFRSSSQSGEERKAKLRTLSQFNQFLRRVENHFDVLPKQYDQARSAETQSNEIIYLSKPLPDGTLNAIWTLPAS